MGLFRNLLGTTLEEFRIGRGKAGNKALLANTDATNKPQLRYNDSSKKWELSNNGTVFTEIPTSSSGGGAADIATVLHQNTNSAVDIVVGAFTFDKTDYASATTIKFKATGYVTSASLTGTLTLYNKTDSAAVTTLSFTSVTLGEQISADVKASLPASKKVYEIRLKVTGGGTSDYVCAEWVGIEIR